MTNNSPATRTLAFIGYGEAASAFLAGWRTAGIDGDRLAVRAFDRLTRDPACAAAKWADYRRDNVQGREELSEALAGSDYVFSLVTSDQALAAAQAASEFIAENQYYLDCNSCSPATKREAASLIEGAGGRYVDLAVMSPVHPKLHRTPLLVSGPWSERIAPELGKLDMQVAIAAGDVGKASSIKMIRSIMVKGMEALTAECFLAARKAGVDDAVISSLDSSFAGFNWRERAAYNLERMLSHGERRAAEMREVARTLNELGVSNAMARASADWQAAMGASGIDMSESEPEDEEFTQIADAILASEAYAKS